MLSEFIDLNREEIIQRCRAKVAQRSMPAPTDLELEQGIPAFLDQLADSLRRHLDSNPDIRSSAAQHGFDLHRLGFTVSQVVHGYGDVCQSITGLAMEANAPITTNEFRTLNACLDDAIAVAVTEYGRRKQSFADHDSAEANLSLGFLTHELRNLANTGLLAFDVLATGNVGVVGSTGAVLKRTLLGIATLVERSLKDTQLTQAVQKPEPILLCEFIRDLTAAAVLEARLKSVRFVIDCPDDGMIVHADRSTLSTVVRNLLQNAFKFTRANSAVTLRTGATDTRVLIEIQDECGGLPDGEGTSLFRPFEQRTEDRSGFGLGLAYCRWALEANHGRITVRNIPGEGCVFGLNLPRGSRAVGPAEEVATIGM